jgi:O-antigen ligase
MRKIAWFLLLAFAFSIPWENSLNLGEPIGNVARVAGLLTLFAAIPAVFQSGRIRTPGAFQWIVLALFLWFCCSCFWTVDSAATFIKLRAYFQVMMIVWLVWELADTPTDLRNLLRATVAGSWVLALLTLAAYRSPEAFVTGQIRFAATGQDPNDLARFLDLGFPLAALLFETDRRPLVRWLALAFLPVGLFAVLLTASREGFVAALIALAGSALILTRHHTRRVLAAAFALPLLIALLWLVVPAGTLDRLATIPSELQTGDLNQRINIWTAGWRAFTHAPLIGSGAGSFVTAAHLAPIDTAHNTALSLLVAGGLVGLFLATVLVALALRATLRTSGMLRIAFITALLVWAVTSLVATVEENRATWLLFAIVVLAGRLAVNDPQALSAGFPARRPLPSPDRQSHPACGGVTYNVTL